MLRAVVLGHDGGPCDSFEQLLGEIGHVALIRKAQDYRLGAWLEPFLRDHAPNLIFLCLKQLGQALECARQLEASFPEIPIIALDQSCNPAHVLELMRVGVRELLTAPFDASKVREALARAAALVEKTPPRFHETKSVFAFLPAQGGAGSSVLAANTAVALSEIHQHRSLLIDCDVINGLSRLFFRGESLYTLLDIAAEAHELDSERWREMVMRHQYLDLVVAGRGGADRRLEPSHMRHLLGYARRSYETICLDVPNLTQVMLESLHAAARIFIVCTPEPHSLFLALEKSRFLTHGGLGEKIQFLINRSDRKAQFGRSDCEDVLGQRAFHVFPNEYDTLQRAIRAGSPVEANSPLGKSFRSFAGSLVTRPASAQPPASHRFLEHFFVPPQSQAN